MSPKEDEIIGLYERIVYFDQNVAKTGELSAEQRAAHDEILKVVKRYGASQGKVREEIIDETHALFSSYCDEWLARWSL